MSESPAHDDQPVRREPQALGAIYERYAPGIYRYIYHRVGDAEQARDVQGEVFLRMVEGIDRYEDRGWPIGAWLYRIAHDRTVDSLRRSGRRQLQSIDATVEEAVEAEGCPAEAAAAALQRAELRAAVERLCESHRQVIRLRFIYDLSLQETANQMGRTVGSVKALQHRAIEQLRRIMGVDLEGEG